MNPRRAAVVAALVAALAVLASVVALSSSGSSARQLSARQESGGQLSGREGTGPSSLTPPEQARPAPELTGVTDFDGTPPLTMSSLRGRVVLVDFWTYTCINCRRTFPFLRRLQQTYADAGLTVLGIHSPEFSFERSHANVARAVRELGVTWPVAEDPRMATWNAWGNQYWPADYLVDRQGRVRSFSFGEGHDQQIEGAVRALLDEDGRAPSQSVGDVPGPERPPTGAVDVTPETYFGSERGAGNTAGGEVVPPGRTVVRHDRLQPRDVLALDGTVTGAEQYLELGAGASVGQRFSARDVYVTAAPAQGQVVLDVTLDGRPLPPERRGRSLRVVGGRTVVNVAGDDLYSLVTGPAITGGLLRLTARGAGLRLFTLTYGA